MKAYKLFKYRKDGSISCLFINNKKRLPLNKWMKSYTFPTEGFFVRGGWHSLKNKYAPHLSKEPDFDKENDLKMALFLPK